MFALHAAAEGGLLLIWREPEAGKAALLAGLAELGPEFKFPKRVLREAMAWLPSRDGAAVPSSPLLNGGAVGVEAGCRIAQYPVTVLPLAAPAAIDLLAQLAGKRMVAPGVLVGDDLAYWTAALKLAAGLVSRGQFLPGIVHVEGGYEARWQPAPAGAELTRLHALACAMPASARALCLGKTDAPPQIPAVTVLTRFVGSVVDSLVRSAAASSAPSFVECLHDRWLRALASKNPGIEGTPGEIEGFAEQVGEWQRPVQVAVRAPFRLCFRLEEPAGDETPWRIEYLLQSAKDPSLLLNARDAWSAKRTPAAALGGEAGAVREHLLASLGQAASICPLVAASLDARAPDGYDTDVLGAHRFLRETAPALEQSGFGVMLPAWWTRRGTAARVKARARVKGPAASSAGLTLGSLIDFDWQVALGDQEISYKELAALAKLKTPLVKVRGQWVEVDANAIKAALDFLKKNPSGRATLGETVRMAVGADGEAGPLEIEGVSATGWMGDVLARLEGRVRVEELPQPEAFEGELRPYQRFGYSWLDFLKRLGLGACLADDMGLGKTVQTLALIEREREAGERRPVLLVCPTSVIGNWRKEAARFTPQLPVLIHHGVTRKRGESFRGQAEQHAMVVSSYALLQRDQAAFESVDWAGVILDEAQNIKNAGTKQARAARAVKSAYRIALTGTPVENNVGDLWSLMEFLNPGLLGGQSDFHKRFFVPIQIYSDRAASDRLRRVTGPFILRRLKTDRSIIADLPDKLEMKVFCNLTKEQGSLYQAVVKETERALEAAEGIERKGLVLSTLMKLKQVCNHPAQFLKDNSAVDGRSGKLARLREMIEETLEEGDRSLVFTQFAEMGTLLQRHLQETFGLEVLFLHGGVAKKRRDEMIERFSAEDGPRVFVLSLKAGGTGLNLTRANHVFHFDRWWNPAVENQATDRAFRIGQTKNVQVHKFVCSGTLEERIDEMIERKRDVAGRVVGAGEGWLTELSNAELKQLFALGGEAVAE